MIRHSHALALALALAAPADAQLSAGSGAVCFAEGTPPEEIAAVHAQLGPPPEYNPVQPWLGVLGSPVTLTWSFAPDGLFIPSVGTWDNGGVGENNALFQRMDNQFSTQGGRAAWIARFQSAFDRWEEITGLHFVRVTDGVNDWDDGAAWGANASATRGDIRIALRNIDGAGSVWGWSFYPGSGGDMMLDRKESWGVNSPNEHRMLRNLVMHELGHGIGLEHVCSSNTVQLMEPGISLNHDGPRRDDFRGAQWHYGDPGESNGSPATAFPLGALAMGTQTYGKPPPPLTGTNDAAAALYSTRWTADEDWYRVTVAGPAELTLVLNPRGSTYEDNTQAANGNCNSGNSTVAKAIADLGVEIVDTDGSTVLAVASAQPAGQQETIANLALPAPGDYFVRVLALSSSPQTQLYDFSLSAEALPVTYCTPGTSASGCQASISGAGTASATAVSGFTLGAAGVEGAKDALFFFGANGRQANPWGSGTSTQCVAPPVSRGGLLSGAGTPGACDGAFVQDLNALWCPTCPSAAKNPGAGALVQAQLWYRDPLNTSNQTTSLSDALEFTVAP